MKKHLRLVFLVLLFLECGTIESMSQEISLAGTWKIKEVDSCTRIIYPGAKVNKYKMNNVAGILTLNSNGRGIIESNTQIFCQYKKFNWLQKTDTLVISILPGHIEGDSYYKIHFQDQRTIKIEKLFGCSRYGLGIWYDVKLEKKE
jgi:hypothetical protein